MRAVHVSCVAGARPNFVKIAPIMHEMRRRPEFRAQLIHTGQHFSPQTSQSFFRELDIPEPDINPEVGRGSHAQQTAEVMRRLEPALLEHRPDVLLVVGDVNSTLAAALVAAKLLIPVAHVEAGLRSQVPCLTLRENTERPVTLGQGTNRLIGMQPEAIPEAALAVLTGRGQQTRVPDSWDGRASSRILDVLRGARR